jgi:hypothetical protein
MGMAAGAVLYIALYYGIYYLSIPFSPHVGFAVPVGAVAGYSGGGMMGKLITRLSPKKLGTPE